MHVLSIDRNKSTLQISGKVAGAFARTLETFQGTHILGASRGRLCDSNAFLLQLELLANVFLLIKNVGKIKNVKNAFFILE